MDSLTHVEFAERLLAICGCSPAHSVASLFPQIDRHPPTLHRMYAHSVFKAGALTEMGLSVLAGKDVPDPAWTFATGRFRQEAARILSYWKNGDWSPATPAAADDGALLAFVSHLYLDAYNQPTQTFAPTSVYCSGQWSLWEQIGDFRLQLYTTPTIDRLRAELFAHSLWQQADKLDALTLTQAMLVRLCRLSLRKVSTALINPAMRSLRADTRSAAETLPAIEFLEEFEDVLCTLHVEHLLPAQTGRAVDAATSNDRRKVV